MSCFLACAFFVCVLALSGCNDLDHSKDAEDIKGCWKVDNSNITCVFTSNQIKMPNDVSYDYTIDTTERTITFSVGGVSGTASYVLETNKDTGNLQLTITESLDSTDTTTTFQKVSDDVSAVPTVTPYTKPISTSSTSTTSVDAGTTTDTTTTDTTTTTTPTTTTTTTPVDTTGTADSQTVGTTDSQTTDTTQQPTASLDFSTITDR